MNLQITYLKALLMILVLTLFACEQKKDNSQKSFGSEFSVNNSITYVKVDSLGLTIYPSEPHVFQIEGQDFLYVYNRPLHSLDVYNLTERRFNYRIMLAKEGPNYINKFYKLNVLRPDSLYVMGAGKLYLIDDSGRLLKAYNMDFGNYEGTISGQFRTPNEANFSIEGSEMIGFFQHDNARGSGKNGEAFEQSILGLYDLDNEILSFLPISYSSFIIENDEDFAEIRPNLSFQGGRLFYGFPVESNIYEYDFLTQKSKMHSAESKFSENKAKRQSQHSDYDYRNDGTWFNRLNQYPEKPYFYRTHWGSQHKLRPDGEPTDASTKPGYIMFFDNELKVIDEIKIDDNCYLEGSFATDEGIFFWAKDGEDESQIKFCHYYIE